MEATLKKTIRLSADLGEGTLIPGPAGAKGETGNGIASAVLNDNYTLTLNFTDGTSYTTGVIRGATGAKGEKGEKGDTGAKGETGATGAKGDTGAKGETGNGIASAVLNDDCTLTLNFTDGTSYTTESIRGAAGAKGEKGDKGDKGAAGDDGYSPTVSTEKTGKVTRVTITDASGEHTFDISDGADGTGSGDMSASVYDSAAAVADAGGIAAYVEEKAALKMNATDPTGSGTFSMNRKAGTDVGQNSHTEGMNVEASGRFSHAEGLSGTASGDAAHTEGMGTTAQGAASHAEGSGTRAASRSQHTQGENNIADTEGSATARGKYAHIVGNGTSDAARSNAHTLDWDGNAWFAGDVYVGGTSGTNRDAGSKKLATEEYADTKAPAYTYGNDDLTAGVSALATGTLYFVYE